MTKKPSIQYDINRGYYSAVPEKLPGINKRRTIVASEFLARYSRNCQVVFLPWDRSKYGYEILMRLPTADDVIPLGKDETRCHSIYSPHPTTKMVQFDKGKRHPKRNLHLTKVKNRIRVQRDKFTT